MSGEHWPQASCDITGSPELACSCGWESGAGTDWYQHLDAAGWAVAPKQDAEDGRALRELREALPERSSMDVGWYAHPVHNAGRWTAGVWRRSGAGLPWLRVTERAPTIAAAADAARLALGDGR